MTATARPRSPRRGRPPAADSHATRRAVLEAAKECFALRGYRGTSMEMIARTAHVSTSVVYYYSAGKAQLFADTAVSLSLELQERYREMLARHTTVVDRVDAILAYLLDLFAADELGVFFLTSRRAEIARNPELGPFLDSEWRVLDDIVARVADDALANGELPRGVSRERVTGVIWLIFDSISYTGSARPTRDEYARTIAVSRGLFRDWSGAVGLPVARRVAPARSHGLARPAPHGDLAAVPVASPRGKVDV